MEKYEFMARYFPLEDFSVVAEVLDALSQVIDINYKTLRADADLVRTTELGGSMTIADLTDVDFLMDLEGRFDVELPEHLCRRFTIRSLVNHLREPSVTRLSA